VQRWTWFLAADDSGRWITTNGIADVDVAPPWFKATLRYESNPSPYQHITGSIDDKNRVSVLVKSPDPETPSYELTGQMWSDDHPKLGVRTSVILTDGTTVIGLANGKNTSKGNL
jgi:hypothetical protein